MGRTFRHRKRRCISTNPVSLCSDISFVCLTKWMASNGWRQSSALRLAKFPDTGRGLMTTQNVREGDILVSIPQNFLVTTATVANSNIGHTILKKMSCGVDSFLCQEILASFLLWEKHLKESSTWSIYISTLPPSFTLPFNLERCCMQNLPYFLKDQVLSSTELVTSCYLHMRSYFENDKCGHCELLGKDIFNWSDFLWSWSCVNTRAVFIEPRNVPSHGLIIKDTDCLALAPYLDMFNHSDSSEMKAELNSRNNCYEITTFQPFKKFSEIFINYGPHSNLKLFLEYGFILPSNVHDCVPINFVEILSAFKSANIEVKSQYEKVQFCQKHTLHTQLYIADYGLSWNLSTSIKILLSDTSSTKIWERILFMAENLPLSYDTKLDALTNCLLLNIKSKLTDAQNSTFGMCNQKCESANNSTLEICRLLLNQFISIINKAL